MKILAIECTHGFASVAVSSADRLIGRCLGEWQKTAEAIVPLIMQAMDDAGLKPADLDGIAVSSGPGSFTALRIGISVAKGIASGTGAPLVSVSTMQAMAESSPELMAASYIVPLIPSRAGEYFCSIYKQEQGALSEIGNTRCLVSELPGRLAAYTGSMAVVSRSAGDLARQLPELAPFLVDATFFSAGSLITYAEKVLSAGQADTATLVVPDYRQVFVPGQRS
jgi:tRNA threonylcarbamoyladenosine biosynthesis protein TsaB